MSTENKPNPLTHTKNEPSPLVYTKAQLPSVIGLGKSAIDKMRRTGDFPQPIMLGGKKVGWTVETIKNWLATRPVAKSIND